jgi:hypothetical protein
MLEWHNGGEGRLSPAGHGVPTEEGSTVVGEAFCRALAHERVMRNRR